MAIFVYTNAKRALLAGEINLATDDMRVMLVMSDTTTDTEKDKSSFAGFTTTDEYDGSGYSSPGLPLSNQSVTADDPNLRGEFDSTDEPAWTLGIGSRQCVGFILYKFDTDLATSIPVAFYDGAGFPFDGSGGLVGFIFDPEGVLQAG